MLFCNVIPQVHLWQGALKLHPNWVWQVSLHSSTQPTPEGALYRYKQSPCEISNTEKVQLYFIFANFQCGTLPAAPTLTLSVLFPTQRWERYFIYSFQESEEDPDILFMLWWPSNWLKDLQADIFLVCFSIAEPISLYNVRSHWAVEVRQSKLWSGTISRIL